MDAGVPIKKPVAGIAMGLVSDGKDHIVLSDIMGFEDHTGDMDFKVAGTRDGITAMQMDVKIKGIPRDVLERALEQARLGRIHILDEMLKPLAEPRKEVSKYAPKITTVKIPEEKIGELIGPGGKIIKGIIAESGAQVDVDDEGNVFISTDDAESMAKARQMVEGIVKEVEVGEEYDGKVVRLANFGAFVEILPGKDGLVHVSRMSTEYVSDPSTVVKEGDMVHVRVTEVDAAGKIALSMLTAEQEETARQSRSDRNGGGGGYRGDRNKGSNRFSNRRGRDRS
jgi:polyribonucleotide nucleotidyltransferase